MARRPVDGAVCRLVLGLTKLVAAHNAHALTQSYERPKP
jgi:hypothetical protein